MICANNDATAPLALSAPRQRPKFMHWKPSIEPLVYAAQWTAIVLAGMLAVMFLTWSLEVTASQNGGVIDYDQTTEINPTF
jgi:hypothetical protein